MKVWLRCVMVWCRLVRICWQFQVPGSRSGGRDGDQAEMRWRGCSPLHGQQPQSQVSKRRRQRREEGRDGENGRCISGLQEVCEV